MGKLSVNSSIHTVAADRALNEDTYKNKRSRSGALTSSLVHIIPVGVTFGILQLSFRNVYWADADAQNQRQKLSALQIAAKVHEIFILVSLSSMVLHYTRKLMVAPAGISFGLLEAAYQSGLSSNPWTIGNWEALKHLRQRIKSRNKVDEAKDGSKIRAWHLVICLLVFAFLALFIGPASAITLIPQLGWWHQQDFFGPMQTTAYYIAPSFSVYVPTDIFPGDVDASSLPGPFCSDAATDTNNTCPSARIAEVERSFRIPEVNLFELHRIQNTTISLYPDDAVPRRMLYTQKERKAAVTVPNYLLASFASLVTSNTFAKTGTVPNVPGYKTVLSNRPFTLEIFANGAAPLDPLVGVDCNDTSSQTFLRDYNYETNGISARSSGNYYDVIKTDQFDIRTIWSEEELKKSINGTELIWKDMTGNTKTPVLLALLRHEGNVTVCAIQSHWTSTSQWILSTSSLDIATNFTFESPEESDFVSKFGYTYSLNVKQIHIHEAWADTLNAVNGSTRVLDDLLQFGIKAIEAVVSEKETNSTKAILKTAHDYFEATIAQLLAKAIANGLSRVGAQYAADNFIKEVSNNELAICNEKTRWCSQGPWLAGREMPLVVTTNTSRAAAVQYFSQSFMTNLSSWKSDETPIMRSFPKPVDADANWTRIEFPIRRYGYAYAFQGITTYLSVALLCLHAAIVLAHVVYRVAFDCEVFEFGGSLGSLLTIAMAEKAPTGGKMWGKHVVLVPFGNAAETTKLKLEVVDCESPTGDGKKILAADPEEAIRLMHHEWLDSRYPSAHI
jgi:hypothetical protein